MIDNFTLRCDHYGCKNNLNLVDETGTQFSDKKYDEAHEVYGWRSLEVPYTSDRGDLADWKDYCPDHASDADYL